MFDQFFNDSFQGLSFARQQLDFDRLRFQSLLLSWRDCASQGANFCSNDVSEVMKKRIFKFKERTVRCFNWCHNPSNFRLLKRNPTNVSAKRFCVDWLCFSLLLKHPLPEKLPNWQHCSFVDRLLFDSKPTTSDKFWTKKIWPIDLIAEIKTIG